MCKKVPSPNEIQPPPLKFQNRPAPWDYNSSKFIIAPLTVGRGTHTINHCIPHKKTKFESFFVKIAICIFPVTVTNSSMSS